MHLSNLSVQQLAEDINRSQRIFIGCVTETLNNPHKDDREKVATILGCLGEMEKGIDAARKRAIIS